MRTVVAGTLALLALLLTGAGPMTVAHAEQQVTPGFHEVPTRVCACVTDVQGAATPGAFRSLEPLAPAPVYDEQLGVTLTQSFTSLAFNVTAVEQMDSVSDDGPAYLLNGLASSGYWYQVGVSWNWSPGSNPGNGFDMNYEVFNTRGDSIFPSDGSGGLQTFSGQVNDGDSILLNLYFSSGEVVMIAHDWNTGASASESFSDESSTTFVGDSSANANSNGYFTGLMTEWYHPSPYTANEKEVVYTETNIALTSAWLWMDEYNPNNGQAVFENSTLAPVTFTSAPAKLQEFASNGATEYMDANELITGAMNATEAAKVPLTLSYSVLGGGTGYSAPVLDYISGGVNINATLGTTPVTFELDNGSQWSVNHTLAGSTASQRWFADSQTNGTAKITQTLDLMYYHQYTISASYSVVGGGTSAPTLSYSGFGTAEDLNLTTGLSNVWADAGSAYSISNPLEGSSTSERWVSPETLNGTVSTALDLSPTYYHQYLVYVGYAIVGGGGFASGAGPTFSGTEFGTPASFALSSPPSSEWLDAGSSYSVTQTISNATAGSSATNQRWTVNGTSGIIVQGLEIQPRYQHQYLVTLQPASPSSGTVSATGGWYDAGALLQVNASAKSGWRFEYWETPQTASIMQVISSDDPLSVPVDRPMNVTALFYPGLTISSGPDVSVFYSYPSVTSTAMVNGTISAGQSQLVYVPPAGVQLSAAASSFLYAFKGWSGASTSSNPSITLSITGPSSIAASTTYNYLDLLIVAGVVLFVVLVLVAAATRGSKKTVGSPAA